VAEELNSLEELFLEEDEELVKDEEDDFLVALRLSPEPVHLVKGYEFKMLNKYTQSHAPFRSCYPSLSAVFPFRYSSFPLSFRPVFLCCCVRSVVP
jgi:hypothetical protein